MANLDTLQIQIEADASRAQTAINNLTKSLQNLNKYLGLADGTKLSKTLKTMSEATGMVSDKINTISGAKLDDVTKKSETAQKAVQQLAKEGENLKTVLKGLKTEDFDRQFGIGNTKFEVPKGGQSDFKGIKDLGFTTTIRDLSAAERLSKEINDNLSDFHTEDIDRFYGRITDAAEATKDVKTYALTLPETFAKAREEAEKIGKNFSLLANNSKSNAPPAAMFTPQVQPSISALEELLRKIREYKQTIRDMESGAMPFNEDAYKEAIKGYADATEQLKKFKKELTGGDKGNFMTEIVPKTILLSHLLGELSEKFGHLADKGKNVFKALVKPLEMASKEYVEKFEHMKEAVSSFKDHVQKQMTKLSAFWKRVMKTFTFMLVRKAITAIIKEVGDAVQSLAVFSKEMGTEFNSSISTLIADFQYLGRSIVSAFAPIIDAVAPVIDMLTDKIAELISYIGMLFAALSGASSFTKAKKTVTDYGQALEDAAKSSKKLTMGIDELNILSEKSSGKSSATDGWEDAWKNVELPDWINDLSDKIKAAFSDLFKPIREAWDNAKDYVLSGWNYMTGQMKTLLADVWNDFIRVWDSSTVEHIFENLLGIIGDIEYTLGNLAKNFDEAWTSGEKGYTILKNIADIADIFVGHVKNVTDYMKEWSEGIKFDHLLESFGTLTESLKKLADFVGGVFEDIMKNVVLKYIQFLIEEGIPHLNKTISEIIDAFDFDKLRAKLEPIEEAFEHFLEAIDIGKTNALGNIGKALAEFTESEEFDAFLGTIEHILNSIDAEDVEKILTGIGQGILDIADALVKFIGSDAFNDFIDAIDKWLENASSEDIAGILKGVAIAIGMFKFAEFATAGFAGFLKFASTIKLLTEIGSATSALKTFLGVMGAVAAIILGAVSAVAAFVDMWTNGWSLIQEVIKDLGIAIVALGAIILGVPALPALVVAAIVAALSTIVILIHEHWDEIKEFFANIAISIVEWISGVATSVAEWFTNILENVMSFASDVGAFFAEIPVKIGEALSAAIDKVVQWGSDVANWIAVNVPQFITSIVTFFAQLPGKIWEWLVGVVTKLKEWATNVLTWTTTTIPKIIEDIVKFFKELPGKIWQHLKEIIEKFGQWKTDAINWITKKIPEIIDKFVQFFKDIPKKLFDLGKDIIGGLIDGVTDAWKNLKKGVSDFCGGFIQKFRDGFRISSPSKEAAEIGDYYMKGLVEPIKIKNVESVIKTFCKEFLALFTKNLTPKMFSELGASLMRGLMEGISGNVNSVNSLFTQIVSTAKSAFSSVKTSIQESINTAMKAVKSACSSMISAINSVINATYDLADAISSYNGFNGTLTFEFGAFAAGGFPQQGSLFLAGESGAEFVSNVNGKTGVVSNGEITGIADAVYSTGNQESQLLSQLINIGQQLLDKDPVVLNDKEVALMATRGKSKLGMSIIT